MVRKKVRTANAQEAAANKKKQQFLVRNGINVKVDGSWGPWQEQQYRNVLFRGMEPSINRMQRDYMTESNDATIVRNQGGQRKPENPHLQQRALAGARAHAAWEKEHPVLNAVGNTLAALPLAVAAYPFVAGAGSLVAGNAGRVAAQQVVSNAGRTAATSAENFMKSFIANPVTKTAALATPTGQTVAVSTAVPAAEQALPAAVTGLLAAGALRNRNSVSYTPVWSRSTPITMAEEAAADTTATATPSDSTQNAATESTEGTSAAPAAPQPQRPRRPRRPRKPKEPEPPEKQSWQQRLYNSFKWSNANTFPKKLGMGFKYTAVGAPVVDAAGNVIATLQQGPQRETTWPLTKTVWGIPIGIYKKLYVTPQDTTSSTPQKEDTRTASSTVSQPAPVDSLNASQVDEINSQTATQPRDSIDLRNLGI